MGTYQKILLATDFSEQCRPATAQAVHLARQYQAELHVVHVEVVGLQGIGVFADVQFPDYIRSMAQIQSGANPELNYRNTVLKFVRDRSEAAGILRYAAEQKLDLIVIGTHGRNLVAEALMGSVAQTVVRESPVSVLVVGDRARRTGPGCILAPVDFSPPSKAALAAAARLAVVRKTRLMALNVVDFARVPHPEVLDIGERERMARQDLENFAASAGLPIAAETLVTVGPAAEEIARLAAKHDASLIVLSPSTHSALQHLWLGSVCRPVIRTAPCPVLVHREAGVAAERRVAA
jgi:nucleotide-binding universal stress UspA family protein